MANTNRFQGLNNGPINHESSSVIEAISNGPIDMGSAVALTSTIFPGETLPRVEEINIFGGLTYGIAVAGVVGGIFGDGSASTDDSTRATNAAGQAVQIVTQGRCLARVTTLGESFSSILIGTPLTQSPILGALEFSSLDSVGIAIALNLVENDDQDMIAVDVHRFSVFEL